MLNQSSAALCLNFTTPYLKAAIYGRAVAGSVACIVCVSTVILIVVLRAWSKFVHRLTVYLATAGFFYSLLLALQGMPVDLDSDVVSLRPGWEKTCVAIGFLAQYTGWVQLTIMSWISVYLALLWKYHKNVMDTKSEIGGIVTAIFLPLLFSFEPFIHNMYGLAGAWCWIKVNKDHSCNETSIRVSYQIGLFYAPVFLFAVTSLFVMVGVLFVFCKNAKQKAQLLVEDAQNVLNNAQNLLENPQFRRKYEVLIRGALPLLIYPAVHIIIHMFAILNRLNYLINTVPNDSKPSPRLWLIHAILPPLIPVAVLFLFMFQPDIWTQIKDKIFGHEVPRVRKALFEAYNAEGDIPLRELGRDPGATDEVEPSQNSSTQVTQFIVSQDELCSDFEQAVPLIVRGSK